jgi:hypothetical protein
MRPPHVRQRVMSMAKTRARSFAQAMRRGLGEDVGEDSAGSSGWAKSSASCGGGGGAAGLGITCSRRRWWLAKQASQGAFILSDLDLGFAVLGNLMQGATAEVASAAGDP